jgi:uncharacterized membrane protein
MHGLTLGAFAGFFLLGGMLEFIAMAAGIAAIAIAATNRQDGMPWARTHHEFGLRTLIIGGVTWVLAGLAGAIPLIGMVAWFVMIGVLLWVGLRGVVGLLRGAARQPMERPTGLLI